MSKCVLLNREEIGVLVRATAKDDSRYALRAVRLTDKYAEATNGHYLVRVPYSLDAAEYPQIQGAGEPFRELLVLAATLEQAAKTLPKHQHMRILEYAHIGQRDGAAVIVTTDLETPHVTICAKVEATFPPTDRIVGQFPESMPTVALSASYLADFGKACRKVYTPDVRLWVKDAESPVHFSLPHEGGERIQGVIMPIRVEKL